MSNVAIRVTGLSKLYKMYSRPVDMLIDAFFPSRKKHREFWALKEISFDVRKGEVLGIVGRNGAGKSTLLKILAGTLDRTTGDIEINGRVSAILELGTGFNPELSGRENAIIGAMCIGMSRHDALAKLESIVEFSGLAKVIDQPFKTYSSGMQARLTFATAIAIDPDVLIVDEALAAGDAYFVNKSLKRIEEICRSGATVLFVSHGLNLIERFCERAILIDHGQIMRIASAKEICKQYELQILQETQKELKRDVERREQSEISDRIGTGDASIIDVKILGPDAREASIMTVGQKASFRIWAQSHLDRLPLIASVQVLTTGGQVVFSTNSLQHLNNAGQEVGRDYIVDKGLYRFDFDFDPLLLGRGDYYLSVGLKPHLKVQSITDYHDYFHMRWTFSIHREAVYQWVSYEQPVTISLTREDQKRLEHATEPAT